MPSNATQIANFLVITQFGSLVVDRSVRNLNCVEHFEAHAGKCTRSVNAVSGREDNHCDGFVIGLLQRIAVQIVCKSAHRALDTNTVAYKWMVGQDVRCFHS